MKTFSRRRFIRNSLLVSTAALSARSWGRVIGSNDDVRVAVIGLNGRGKNHLSSLAAIPGVRVVALCDPDQAVLARTVNQMGGGVTVYPDVRNLLKSSEIDAVTIATPNHWHSLGAIWACQAGKDVYVEKPVSHNVWEGRQLAAAATKYNRVVQAGTQIRSGEGLIEAVQWVQAGNLGKITAARGFCYKRRKSIGQTSGPQPIPATINYDLWCGPAPLDPLRRAKLHYDWHWQYVTGNGDVGNQGIHQMDVARWFLGEQGLPRHTLSIGGRLGYRDDGDTPNTQVIIHDYATAPLIFEVRGLPASAELVSSVDVAGLDPAEAAGAAAGTMDKYRGVSIGNVIDCEGGALITAAYTTATAVDREGKVLKEFKGTDRHMANFIDVVRSRRTEQLYGQIDQGHVSSALCHLGNISHQLGRAVPAGETAEKIKGNALLNEAYGRMTEHLAKNGVNLSETPATLGVPLTLDSAAERFTGEESERANKLLTRDYRKGYVVPQLAKT
jgi:predicted dehydrogenase